jgi:hypothetical protein
MSDIDDLVADVARTQEQLRQLGAEIERMREEVDLDGEPVVAEDTLTLGQLADCVAGLVRPKRSRSVHLYGSFLAAYDRAREQGWALITHARHDSWKLEWCWHHYCRLSGRPYAVVKTAVRLKRDSLGVSLEHIGQMLPRAAAHRVADFIRPFLVFRDGLSYSSHGISVQMHDKEKARELIMPVLDMVQEGMVPRKEGDRFWFSV